MITETHIRARSVLTRTEGLAQAPVCSTFVYVLTLPASDQGESFGAFAVIGAHTVDAVASLAVKRPLTLINIFTVAAFLCTLVSRVALTLERAICVDALTVGTQPSIFTLINITASLAVCRWEEALITKTAVSPWEVLTAAVWTDAWLLTLIYIIADAASSLVSWEAGHTLIRPWCVLALLIGTRVWT